MSASIFAERSRHSGASEVKREMERPWSWFSQKAVVQPSVLVMNCGDEELVWYQKIRVERTCLLPFTDYFLHRGEFPRCELVLALLAHSQIHDVELEDHV